MWRRKQAEPEPDPYLVPSVGTVVVFKPHRSAHAAYTGHMAGLDIARNALRAWAVTNGSEVVDRPYESWNGGLDKSFTQDGTYDIYWAVK